MKRMLFIAVSSLLLLSSACSAQSTKPTLERCRAMDFSLKGDKFNEGWQERVSLEFEVVNDVKLASLRDWLSDDSLYVRAMACLALGIRADKESAAAIASLAQNDPEYLVRVRAVEALGLLKTKPAVIEAARKQDKHGGVRWAADLSADMLKRDDDYAEQLRQAFAEGIRREEMGQAVVGKPAPDFSALTVNGTKFQLSSVLRKKPIILYFAAFDS